jgi:hypothetical protein
MGGARSLPVPGEAVEQPLVVRTARTRLSEYHDVESLELVLVLPERFPNDALQPVPPARGAAMFFGNCKPQSCTGQAVGARQNREQGIAASFRSAEYAAEGRCIRQAVAGLEPKLPITVRFGGSCLVIRCRRRSEV